MNKNKVVLLPVLSAVFFTLLFYKQSIGLNLFIFETILLIILGYQKKISFKTAVSKILFTGTAVSSVTVLLYSTIFTLIVNLLSWTLFIGSCVYPSVRLLFNALGFSILNLIDSQKVFYSSLSQAHIKGFKFNRLFKYIRNI